MLLLCPEDLSTMLYLCFPTFDRGPDLLVVLGCAIWPRFNLNCASVLVCIPAGEEGIAYVWVEEGIGPTPFNPPERVVI